MKKNKGALPKGGLFQNSPVTWVFGKLENEDWGVAVMGQAGDSFKVVTFNLRKDSVMDLQNRWTRRRNMVLDFIRNSGASIIGVQELMPSMKQDMVKQLDNYSIFGSGRSRKMFNEHSDILVNNEDVEVDFSKTIWLSKNPEKKGSHAFLAFFPRICTICEVKFKDTGRKIRVFNAHFDHISKWAREIGVEMILSYMAKFQQEEPMPMVLMGDFNVKPTNRLITKLRKNLNEYGIHLVDAYHYIHRGCSPINTYHGFKGKRDGTRQLDYIFVSDDLQVLNTYVDRTENHGRYLSDHYPMVATLRFKDA